MDKKRISPLYRQCFASSGVLINYMTHALVMVFTSILIPALRESTDIHADDATASWIASIFGISLLFGALTVPSVMGRFGRKPANVFSAALMAAGWLGVALAASAQQLLLARFLQGYSMGFLAILGSVLIGEYSHPKYRGALLASISLFIMMGVLIVHGLGTLLPWKMIGLIFAIISFLNLLIALCSPESPSFLANRGRYDECRKAYHWLRGHDDDEELEKLIRTDMARKRNKVVDNGRGISSRITRNLAYAKITLAKKEVFKPIIITLHLHAMNQWSGVITFDAYTKDILDSVIGKDINSAVVLMSLDIQRILTTIITVFTVKKIKRKVVLATTVSVNIIGYLGISLFVYLKSHNLLGSDMPLLGVFLLHIHIFSLSAGSMTLSNIIPGEIFPMEHRGFCGVIGILFFSINETINIKSAPYLFSSIGVHGAYLMYVSIVIYCLSVAWVMLPETKDRTLLDIEEEFRGEPLISEANLTDSPDKFKIEYLDRNP